MRRSLLAVVAVAALALALAAPAGAKSARVASSSDRGAAARDAVREYWTPARRANAKPRNIVLPLGTKARPTKPGGGSTTSAGAAWTQGGAVDATTGKVFFTLGGTNYVCSGSAVKAASGSANVVSTAGHCVHEGDGSGAAGYATKFAFYPDYARGQQSSNSGFVAIEKVATANWQAVGAAHGAYPNDAAFVRVDGGPSNEVFATKYGAALPTVSFAGVRSGSHHAFGYPAAGKYNGYTLSYCAGGVLFGYDNEDTISMVCDMTGGSSGGPWFSDFSNTKTNVQTSVNSYGYGGLKRMFGPVFDGQESTAYTAASS